MRGHIQVLVVQWVLPNFLVDGELVIGVVLELEVACILFPVVGLVLVLVGGIAVEINCPRLSKAGDFTFIVEMPNSGVVLAVEVACILLPVIGLVLVEGAALPVVGEVLKVEVVCILFPVIGLVLVLVAIAVEINCPRLSKAGDFNLIDEMALFGCTALCPLSCLNDLEDGLGFARFLSPLQVLLLALFDELSDPLASVLLVFSLFWCHETVFDQAVEALIVEVVEGVKVGQIFPVHFLLAVSVFCGFVIRWRWRRRRLRCV